MKKIIVCFIFLLLASTLITGCYPPVSQDHYTVVFMAEDGTVLDTQEIPSGKAAIAPEAPAKEGYNFSGWDQDFTSVTKDLEVKATYTAKAYFTVVFVADEVVLDTQQVLEGESATAPEAPAKDGYSFNGWDKSFAKVTKDLTVTALYTPIPVYYTVRFLSEEGTELDVQQVLKGTAAEAPAYPTKEGYRFIGWDQDFSNVTGNMDIRPLYEWIDPSIRKQYVSYAVNPEYLAMAPLSEVLGKLDYASSLIKTMTNVIAGGFRNTNELRYYDASNIPSRNVYGFEVAVDASGIAIDKATIVDLPDGGFILSGHGTSANLLSSSITLGDIIVYDRAAKTAKVYRDYTISNVIGLNISINDAMARINASGTEYRAVDYVAITEKINESINLYNQLAASYESALYTTAKGLLLDVDFLLVESVPVQTKAFWHYPLRSGSYTEKNVGEVQNLLDQVSAMGFNRIYLNTNFGGWSVYKSQYLTQQLATYYTYDGYVDYLDCFIKEAHMRNIEVYAWTNTLIAGDGSVSTWYRNKGWILTGYNNEDNFGGMYFLDISNPEVQTFLGNVYGELAGNYELDGIEFDFIRYPNGNLQTFSGTITNTASINDSGYTSTFMNAFMTHEGLSGDMKILVKDSQDVRTKWLAFKMELLNDTVEMLTTTIKNARPGIIISAAVMPNINSAKTTYLQDWKYWIGQGWVDMLDPMLYSGSTDYVISALTSMYAKVNGEALIVAGLFPEGDGCASGMNAEQIAKVADAFIDVGWVKFSSKTIFSNALLTHSFEMMARDYTARPNDSNDLIYRAYISDLLDKVDHYYRYADQSKDYTTLLTLLEGLFAESGTRTAAEYLQSLTQVEAELNTITNGIIRTRLLNNLNYVKSLI